MERCSTHPEMRNLYIVIFVGKPEGKNNSEEPRVDGRIIVYQN
jgi:hypothetical protein